VRYVQNTIHGNSSTWKECNKIAKNFRKSSIRILNWQRKIQRGLLKGSKLDLTIRKVNETNN
jgi:hypothetical protein